MNLERITFMPDQMGGQACIRGLPITVATIVRCVAEGMSTAKIRKKYSDLEERDIREVLQHAAMLIEREKRFVNRREIEQRIKDAIEAFDDQLQGQHDNKRDEWLMAIHRAYFDRFIHDNTRIWSSGAILLPISLAGFAVLPAVESPQLIHGVGLAVASCALLFIWLIMADNHRAFQDKSMIVVRTIETHVGFRDDTPAKVWGWLPVARYLRVRLVRWVLFILVLSLWVFVLKITDWGGALGGEGGVNAISRVGIGCVVVL